MNKSKRKPTINIIVKYFFPINAGIEKSIYSTSVKLKEKGWDVIVHTSTDTLTEKNILQSTESAEGIQINRYKVGPLGFFSKFHWRQTDVISVHNFNIVPHIYIFVKTLFLKYVGQKHYILELTPHGGLTPEWQLFSQPTRFIKKLYHTTLGIWLINSAVDKVRAVSDWEAKEIIKMGVKEKKVVVIANGIEDIAFQKSEDQISQETKDKVAQLGDFIVTLCRIDPVKNIETLIRALPLINSSVKLVVLGPVGDMDYYQSLKNLVEKLLVSDRVIFYGEVTGFEKYYILSQAKAMVHMSICESYCIAVREGMSQGLVCIVSDNSALSEFVKNDVNGYKVGTLDWEELGRRINILLSPTAEGDFERIKRYNKRQSLETTWDAIATQLNDLYQPFTKVKHK